MRDPPNEDKIDLSPSDEWMSEAWSSRQQEKTGTRWARRQTGEPRLCVIQESDVFTSEWSKVQLNHLFYVSMTVANFAIYALFYERCELHSCCIMEEHVTHIWAETHIETHTSSATTGNEDQTLLLCEFSQSWGFPVIMTFDRPLHGQTERGGGRARNRDEARVACCVVVSTTEASSCWPCIGAAVRALHAAIA